MNIRTAKRNKLNLNGVIRIIGFLLLIEAVFMSAPLITAVIFKENIFPFLLALIITLAWGIGTICLSSKGRRDLGRREGYLLTALVWVVFSIFGMLPFMISEITHFDISNAFFEAMSGFTTTGASVLDHVDHLPKSMHMWRCLMQWIGGMGIIIFTIALIPMFNNAGGMQMFNAEVTGITHDKIRPRISQTAKRLWLIYAILTFILGILLWLGPMNVFESLCHALTTVSTGGFSTSNESIGAWDSMYVKIVVMIFMFLGGVNFALIYHASQGRFRIVWKNDVFRAYLKIILAVTLFFILMAGINVAFENIEDYIIDPLFLVISTISSTGLIIADFTKWGNAIYPILFILMFFGACAGSTSGGAKIDRILYLWRNTKNEINRCIRPNRFYSLTINGRAYPPEMLGKVVAFISLFFCMMAAGSVALALTGIPLADSVFASFSCIANTGIGVGATATSFDIIPDTGKWILSALMLIGRLEIFTILLMFAPGFWKK